ncbi:translation initiation factor 4B [Cryptococcus neoformans Tu259-1]|uniref:Translation initiation factor 4B n=1 Tax=Cryptococcus neoformans Tu259-1 TaxID=1230072 RepID=A0A854QKJ2_CRYNE|nr:translation initiation factor 4B [Cryptococcus neoformans var. grubii Tu259-1]
MAPKKKGQKMALHEFFEEAATSGTSWADDDFDLPTAPAAREESGSGLKRGDPGYFESLPDRGSRQATFAGAPVQREELPLPTVPPFTAFIGNLSFEPDVENEVRAFFNDLDPVSVRIVKDPQGKPKGFGYAEFKTQDGLKQALDRSMSQLQGRTIRVNVAEAPSTSRHPPSAAEEASQWRRSTPLASRESSSQPSRRTGGPSEPAADLDWSVARGAKFTPSAPAAPLSGVRRDSSGPGHTREPRDPGVSDTADQWRSNKPLAEKVDRDVPPHQAGVAPPIVSPSLADTEQTWSRGTKLRTPTTTSRQSSADSTPSSGAPQERRKLNLKPRTAGSPSATANATPAAPASGIFGAAKPIDSAAREKAAEEKLAQREGERRKAREEAEKQKAAAGDKPVEGEKLGWREEKLRSIKAAQDKVAGKPTAAPATTTNTGANRKGSADRSKKDEQGFEQVQPSRKSSQTGATSENKPKKDYSTRPQFSFAAAAGAIRNDLVEDKDEEEVTKGVEEVKI